MTITCTECSVPQDESEFRWRNTRSKYATMCRSCEDLRFGPSYPSRDSSQKVREVQACPSCGQRAPEGAAPDWSERFQHRDEDGEPCPGGPTEPEPDTTLPHLVERMKRVEETNEHLQTQVSRLAHVSGAALALVNSQVFRDFVRSVNEMQAEASRTRGGT